MGAALCACAGRADDEPPLYRVQRLKGKLQDESLLQTQSRAETRELLSDEERDALRTSTSVRVLQTHSTAHYNFHHSNTHHAALAQYGYVLPQGCEDGTESDEVEYYNRQQQHGGGGTALQLALTLPARRRAMMNQATADAFRTKLREPIMSPRSKMQLLVGTEEDEEESQEELSIEDKDACSVDGERRMRSDSAVYEVDPADDDDGTGDMSDDESEEYFEYARIIVPPGPCGVLFQTPTESSMAPTVEGFVRMYDGSKGVIENSGLVQKGSTLCAINDLEVAALPLTEVVRALNLSAHLEREFVFRK